MSTPNREPDYICIKGHKYWFMELLVLTTYNSEVEPLDYLEGQLLHHDGNRWEPLIDEISQSYRDWLSEKYGN